MLLADRRVRDTPGGTLINIGRTHAQKSGLFSTDGIEWLGDYLVHESPASKETTLTVLVSSGYNAATLGIGGPDFDPSGLPANELLRVMSTTGSDQNIFLTLDAPTFSAGRIPLNITGDIYLGAMKEQHEVVLLLPLAHQDFVGD